MKRGMQESYEKGVANHSAPSFALCIVRCTAKRKQGYRRAGYCTPKRCNQDADAFDLVEGNMAGAISRVPCQSCVVEDPRHVWKLHAREPGDLGGSCCSKQQDGG